MPITTTDELNTAIAHAGVKSHSDQWSCLARLAQYRLVLKKSLQYVRPGNHALDWGSGNGHFSFFLVQNGIQTVAYSFEEAPAYLVGQPLFEHRRASLADPTGLPFPAQSFDAVFSIGVLEHVHETGGDALASMKEIWKILRPGGLFLVFHLPNRGTWIEAVIRAANRIFGTRVFAHSRRFQLSEVQALCQESRFEILEYGRYNFFPRNQTTRLPKVFSESASFVNALNAVDDFAAAVLPQVCQNWFFILRKPTAPPSSASDRGE